VRFSAHVPTAAEGLAYPAPFATADDLVRIAVAAERFGFDGVWGNDHLTTQRYVKESWPEPPNYYDVLISLSFIAAATERIEIGTGLLIPTMRFIPALAKQLATLDQLSHGRLRVGVGVGAYREEFEAVRPREAKSAHRGDWLDESIEALRLLFTEREATYSGKYVEFAAVESYPKPLQTPLPIYVGGHGEQAIERAGRVGDGWLPGWQPLPELKRRIELLRACAAGRPVEVAPQLSVTLGKTQEAAEASYWDSQLVRHRKSLAYTGRDLSLQAEANLVGTPDAVREKVAALAEIGVDHCCSTWFTGDTVDELLEQMQWFAEEVIA
jgi:probable F420-dependent oxidoreductase